MARSSPQSAQRYPLTTILGADANVRLLRELSRHGGQLSAPSLAVRTGLARASVWAALIALERTGIVASAGSGRARLYQVRTDHPLSVSLGALFEAEEARFVAICDVVRSAAREAGALAAWIYGSVARDEDRPGSDLDIVIVAEPRKLQRAVAAVRDALPASGEKLGFTASIVGLEPGDIRKLSGERDPWWTGVAADALVLAGPRPDELVRREPENAAA